MSRLWKSVATAVAALSVVAMLPQAAWAVEGMGAAKGSFIYFPYWDNVGANRTFFRIAMDTEINDVFPLGTISLHLFYLSRNPLATSINQEIPACFEYDRYITFTPDDWEIVNTYTHSQQFSGGDGRLGWAFAYVVLRRPDAPPAKLLWDRFFSDTFIVDTTLGTIVGWNNMQTWGNNYKGFFGAPPPFPVVDNDLDGACDYTRDIQNDEFNIDNAGGIPWGPPLGAFGPGPVPVNDVCLLGPDDGTATLSTAGYTIDPVAGVSGLAGDYIGEDFGDTFYAHYFTERKNLTGGTFSPTEFSISPVHVDDTVNPVNGFFDPAFGPAAAWPQSAFFNIADDTDDLSYQFDVEVFDHNETVYSSPPRFIICHGLRSIHQLTNNITLNLRQGHLTVWEVDFVFGTAASEDAAWIGVDSLNAISGVAGINAAFAVHVAHNRTTAAMSFFDWFVGIQSPTFYDPDTVNGAGDP